MEEVTLYDKEGKREATTVLVPVFNPKAEVIVWGSRTFVLKGDKYCEGFAYYASITK
jgi:hypothetical protein